MYILVVNYEPDYAGIDIHGPFDTLVQAQAYAEKFRGNIDELSLLVEATPENNDAWTELGWYFGIKEPKNIFEVNNA